MTAFIQKTGGSIFVAKSVPSFVYTVQGLNHNGRYPRQPGLDG